MMEDSKTKTHCESLANEWKYLMGFWTRTTVAPGLSKANNGSGWAKPWILTPWCGLLVYALRCKGIVVIYLLSLGT